MLTAHVLTRNNISTIERCVESALAVADRVIVGDLGSEDGTQEVCRGLGAEVVSVRFGGDYSEARNGLLKEGSNMYLEPWEFVAKGGELIRTLSGGAHLYVVQGGFISKQVRVWKDGLFVNPVFERVSGAGGAVVKSDIVIASAGEPDSRTENTDICRLWARRRPTSPEPRYYLACSLLAQGLVDEFMAEARVYLSMDKEGGESSLLMNYYLSRVEFSKGMLGDASKRAAACVALKPTFAEFWCLLGDMMYSRGKFSKAAELYRNARVLGSRRRSDDTFPIEVSKYGRYPRLMEEKCEKSAKSGLVVASKSP